MIKAYSQNYVSGSPPPLPELDETALSGEDFEILKSFRSQWENRDPGEIIRGALDRPPSTVGQILVREKHAFLSRHRALRAAARAQADADEKVRLAAVEREREAASLNWRKDLGEALSAYRLWTLRLEELSKLLTERKTEIDSLARDTESPIESLTRPLAEAQAATTALTSRLTAHRQAEGDVLRPLLEAIQNAANQLMTLHQGERARRIAAVKIELGKILSEEAIGSASIGLAVASANFQKLAEGSLSVIALDRSIGFLYGQYSWSWSWPPTSGAQALAAVEDLECHTSTLLAEIGVAPEPKPAIPAKKTAQTKG
jgi:hypothetical protein